MKTKISKSCPHTKPDETASEIYELRQWSVSKENKPQITGVTQEFLSHLHTGSPEVPGILLLSHSWIPPHAPKRLPELSHHACIPLRKTERGKKPSSFTILPRNCTRHFHLQAINQHFVIQWCLDAKEVGKHSLDSKWPHARYKWGFYNPQRRGKPKQTTSSLSH